MNSNAIEKCVAILAIALVAIFSPKFGMDNALSSAAIAAIAGLAGSGVAGIFKSNQSKTTKEA